MMKNDSQKKEFTLFTHSAWIASGLLFGLNIAGLIHTNYLVCLIPLALSGIICLFGAAIYSATNGLQLNLDPCPPGANLVIAMMVVLKLTGFFAGSWWMVFWPLWGSVAAAIAITVCCVIVSVCCHK